MNSKNLKKVLFIFFDKNIKRKLNYTNFKIRIKKGKHKGDDDYVTC